MFSSFSCNFSTDAKFRDKFIFNGGKIDPNGSIKIISEAESNTFNEDSVIDWWILDSIRLKRVLSFDWYRSVSTRQFLSSFRFHFFTLEDFDEQNSLLLEESAALPIDLIKSLIKRFGGTVCDTIDSMTTHVVTQFDCEHLLPTQLLGPVHFVTLSWLLKILSKGEYFDPIEAIDFPCPIHPIPESSSLVVCLSGFKSNDKKLLTAQLTLMGIKLSNDLSACVTHLICEKREGNKFQVAQKMDGIRIVDRNWIDECYKKWQIIH